MAPAPEARSTWSPPPAPWPCSAGRSYALPQDVQELARDVLRHRLVLTYQALAEQVTPDSLLTAVLAAIPPPRIDLAREQPA